MTSANMSVAETGRVRLAAGRRLVGSSGMMRELQTGRTIEHSSPLGGDVVVLPDGKGALVGYDGQFVARLTMPDGTFEAHITRLRSDVHTISVDQQGHFCAVSGDDLVIKVVDLGDTSSLKVLKGHTTPIKNSSISPCGRFVISIGCDGTVRGWNLDHHRESALLKDMVPKTTLEDKLELQVSWDPSGSYVIFPGTDCLYTLSAGSWEKKKISIQQENISCVALSPSGSHLATSGIDGRICMWEWPSCMLVGETLLQQPCCSMRWDAEELHLADYSGTVTFWSNWNSMNTSSNKTAAVSSTESNNVVDQEDSDVSSEGRDSMDQGSKDASESVNDNSMDHEKELQSDSAPTATKKRKLTKTADGFYSEDDMEHNIDTYDLFEEEKEAHVGMAELQDTFQPTSTPQTGTERLMLWNLFGSIESHVEANQSVLSIKFSDVSFHRPIRLTDHFGFSMAAMGPRGAVFASPAPEEPDQPPSTLMFRPFNSWASNSDWRITFEKAAASCLAMGDKWIAVGTQDRVVRCITLGGREMHSFSVSGPLVSIVGDGSLLCVVYHAGIPIGKDQNLNYLLFDVQQRKQVSVGALGLSPGAALEWIGFAEFGVLCSFDSKGLLRGCFAGRGYMWVPIMDASKHSRGKEQVFWVTGVTNDSAMGVLCKRAQGFPSVSPRPLMHAFPLEAESLQKQTRVSEFESKYALAELFCDEEEGRTGSRERDLVPRRAHMDKLAIKLIQLALEEDNQFRALDLCMSLHFAKSVSIALRLAQHMKKSILAQKMELVLHTKFEAPREGPADPPAAAAPAMTQEGESEVTPTKSTATRPSLVSPSTPKPGSFAARLLEKRGRV